MRVKMDDVAESDVARVFLLERFQIKAQLRAETWIDRLITNSIAHLLLVVVSLVAALGLGLPLGILAAKRPLLGHLIISVVGLLQTIPALALFVVLIPLLGIGTAPTIMALFLYSLLPIVRNTHAGLSDISPPLRDAARALGLPPRARLLKVELPLASTAILAGIKTAAVINVGLATLGAIIGAGGYGQPIMTGIRRDDFNLILEGAVPAAVLALLVQGMFDWIESRRLQPRDPISRSSLR